MRNGAFSSGTLTWTDGFLSRLPPAGLPRVGALGVPARNAWSRDGRVGSQETLQQAVIALIENLQRADLTPDEICEGVERLHQMTGCDGKRTPALALRASAGASVAQMLGRSERTLRRYRRLSALPSAIRTAAA
jgi:hypothetical protein